MRYVIVGAGLSGHQAAIELSRLAPGAAITLIGAERGLPYDRPPLSKAVLLGDEPDARELALPAAGNYAANGIDYHPGVTATGIDRPAQILFTDDGRVFPYDRLLLAMGSRPRELPCFKRSGPGSYLRVLDDSLHLRRALSEKGHVVVVGGGFIGLEVAAAARSRGCTVTVIEASPRLLARGMPDFLSDWVLLLHKSQGVVVEFGAAVEGVRCPEGGGYEITAGGRMLHADAMLVGIGVAPNTELAAASGLSVADGIVVDDHCRTNDDAIFAAGEVSAHPNRPDGRLRRVESWRTSMDHGIAAARNMAGVPTQFDSVPWFWSDQFEQNIQSVGFPDEATRYTMVEGSTDKAWTLVGFGDHDELVGAVSANRGRDISMLKRAMEGGRPLPQSMRMVEMSTELHRT